MNKKSNTEIEIIKNTTKFNMADISGSDLSGCNYYKGIALSFKEKQKKDHELEAYLRESMRKYCKRPVEDWAAHFDLSNNNTSSSEATEDCNEYVPRKKPTGNCIFDSLNSMLC